MQFLKKHVTRTALVLALGTGILIGSSSSASAAYLSYKCDDGRACVYDTLGQVWNMEHCGNNPIYGRFNYAKAHGNTFRVWYQNNTWDFVSAWTERSLDGGNMVTQVDVYC
ncbi:MULTISPECIES: hypothetical protein [Streptomyces]|jgi:hypothetical protein|uniref:hypothetical protein n=1 Tax=Streptomyces TaxID=1883 RepID=UPI0005954A07|nr:MULTISPECIES: hypothetical protein [Streptomyces]MCF0087102.1 hypothetical protein [Streptomyces sp. MH192]MCF0099242.1 hypothetical protein [Streptomyces sp. MH191]